MNQKKEILFVRKVTLCMLTIYAVVKQAFCSAKAFNKSGLLGKWNSGKLCWPVSKNVCVFNENSAIANSMYLLSTTTQYLNSPFSNIHTVKNNTAYGVREQKWNTNPAVNIVGFYKKEVFADKRNILNKRPDLSQIVKFVRALITKKKLFVGLKRLAEFSGSFCMKSVGIVFHGNNALAALV